MFFGGEANLEFGTGEYRYPEVLREVEVVTGHNRYAHTELSCRGAFDNFGRIQRFNHDVFQGIGVVVELQTRFHIEVGDHGDVVYTPEFNAASIFVDIQSYTSGCYFARAGDFTSDAYSEIGFVVGIVEDVVLRRHREGGETCEGH